jgi:hypothetical protein
MKTRGKRLPWLLALVVALVAVTLLRGRSRGQSAAYPQPTESLELILGNPEFEIPAGPLNAWASSDAGDFHFLALLDAGRRWKITRRSADGMFHDYEIPALPELTQDAGQAMQDIAVDSFGNVYVPMVWRYTKQDQGVGILVFGREGRLTRLVKLEPRTEARKLTIGGDGSLYVLGVDPGFFNRKIDECYLLHKYTPQGQRVVSFSSCPNVNTLRQTGTIRPGSGFARLIEETQRGSIWLKGETVYQLLPHSQEIRKFSTSGAFQSSVVFDLPHAGHPGDIALQAFERNDGTFLVVWLRQEQTGTNTVSSGKYLAVHDGVSGRVLSQIKPVRRGDAAPFASDGNGGILAISRGPAGLGQLGGENVYKGGRGACER